MCVVLSYSNDMLNVLNKHYNFVPMYTQWNTEDMTELASKTSVVVPHVQPHTHAPTHPGAYSTSHKHSIGWPQHLSPGSVAIFFQLILREKNDFHHPLSHLFSSQSMLLMVQIRWKILWTTPRSHHFPWGPHLPRLGAGNQPREKLAAELPSPLPSLEPPPKEDEDVMDQAWWMKFFWIGRCFFWRCC